MLNSRCVTTVQQVSRILFRFFFCSTASTDMRYSTELCKEEKKFILRREEFVFEAMRTFLGDRGPQTIDEVSVNIEIG